VDPPGQREKDESQDGVAYGLDPTWKRPSSVAAIERTLGFTLAS
jgi:hypothetical protein